MSEASIPDRVAALQAVLQPPTGPSVARKASLPELEELKRWLDNSRLEVWGKLRAAQEPAVPDFEHKFRIRRAVELCDGLSADIRAH